MMDQESNKVKNQHLKSRRYVVLKSTGSNRLIAALHRIVDEERVIELLDALSLRSWCREHTHHVVVVLENSTRHTHRVALPNIVGALIQDNVDQHIICVTVNEESDRHGCAWSDELLQRAGANRVLNLSELSNAVQALERGVTASKSSDAHTSSVRLPHWTQDVCKVVVGSDSHLPLPADQQSAQMSADDDLPYRPAQMPWCMKGVTGQLRSSTSSPQMHQQSSPSSSGAHRRTLSTSMNEPLVEASTSQSAQVPAAAIGEKLEAVYSRDECDSLSKVCVQAVAPSRNTSDKDVGVQVLPEVYRKDISAEDQGNSPRKTEQICLEQRGFQRLEGMHEFSEINPDELAFFSETPSGHAGKQLDSNNAAGRRSARCDRTQMIGRLTHESLDMQKHAESEDCDKHHLSDFAHEAHRKYARPHTAHQLGKLIVVTGLQGGSGTSSIAQGLACWFAGHEVPTILIDTQPLRQVCAHSFGLEAATSEPTGLSPSQLLEYRRSFERSQRALIDELVASTERSDEYFRQQAREISKHLLLFEPPQMLMQIAEKRHILLQQFIEDARAYAQVVIVDVGQLLLGELPETCARLDRLVTALAPHDIHGHALTTYVHLMQSYKMARTRLLFVINGLMRQHNAEELMATVRRQVAITSVKTLPHAGNKLQVMQASGEAIRYFTSTHRHALALASIAQELGLSLGICKSAQHIPFATLEEVKASHPSMMQRVSSFLRGEAA